MGRDNYQSPQEFRQQLEALGSDYLLVDQDSEKWKVEIRFIGSFQGREVIWNARLLALGNESGAVADRKQFMEVTHRDALDYDLEVGLAVPVIDTATILKTIIMTRKYKRVQIGYHVFGSGVI